MLTTMCFTGHRPSKLGGYDETKEPIRYIKYILTQTIQQAYAKGYRTFICGGALGVDTWAQEAAMELKAVKGLDDMQVIMAVPCTEQASKWPEQSQDRYESLLRMADGIVLVPCSSAPMTYENYLSQAGQYPYDNRCMHARDEWMVDHSNCVVAVWDGSSGGTGHTVKYARSRSKSVLRIHPDHVTRKVEWLGDS